MSSHGILQDVNILDWAVTRKRSGAFTSQPGCTGVPNSSLWYAGNLFVNIAESAWSIILIEASSMVAWYNATESGVWKGWQPLATATPPQEFDLPLAEGLTALHPSTYRKDQFSVVTVGGAISGDMIIGKGIATLPAGFRPSEVIERDATFISSKGRIAGSIQVNLSGEITLNTDTNITAVFFELSFISS